MLPALAALALAVWRIPLFSRGLPLFGNLFLFYHPLIVQVERQLQCGVLPLWNPYEFCGSPLLADPQAGALFPLHALFSLFPFPLAFRLELAADAVLLTVGAALLARSRGAAGLAAALAGLVAGCGGFPYYHAGLVAQVDSLALMPLVLLFWSEGRPLLTALALALQYLGGHPFFVYMTLGMALALCPRRRLLPGLAAGAGALAVCAVQLLPALRLFHESLRSGALTAQAALVYSLSPRALMTMLLRPWWNRAAAAFSGDPTITSFYVGLPALALAAAGLGRPRTAAPAAWAAGGALLMLGGSTPAYGALLRALPGLALFRFPAQWGCAASLGLALLAAAGAGRLSRPARALALAAVFVDLWVFAALPATARARAGFYRLRPALVARGLAGGDRRAYLADPLLAALHRSSAGQAPGSAENDWSLLVESLAPSHPTVFGVREIRSDDITRPAALERVLAEARANGRLPALLRFLGVSVVVDGRPQHPRAAPVAGAAARVRRLPAGAVETLQDAPDRLRLRVEGPRPGLVTVADRLTRGWEVFIDGRPARATPYLGAFRSCAVPSGTHEVVWLYRPAPFYRGLALTLLALLAFGLWGLRAALGGCA